jgi:hypothetical protein
VLRGANFDRACGLGHDLNVSVEQLDHQDGLPAARERLDGHVLDYLMALFPNCRHGRLGWLRLQ